MIPSRLSFRLALFATISVIILGATMWRLDPADAIIWAIAMGLMPVFWIVLEFRMRDRPGKECSPEPRDRIRYAITGASLLMAMPLAFQLATELGALGDGQSLDERAFGVVLGLILAAYGNFMPKQLSPMGDETSHASARKQSTLRFAGWVFVIVGLVHALVWIALPIKWANTAAMIDVAFGLAMVLIAALISARGRNDPPSGSTHENQ
jgi:hypothetical protein